MHARGDVGDDFHEGILIRRSVELDLAILQPLGSFTVNYAMLSPGQKKSVEVGMEVFTICYPHSPKYTYACGQITSPNYWLVREVRHE